MERHFRINILPRLDEGGISQGEMSLDCCRMSSGEIILIYSSIGFWPRFLLATRPSLKESFEEEVMKNRRSRDEAVYRAYFHYGYTLKEIAEYLGVHYATVSRALRGIERQK